MKFHADMNLKRFWLQWFGILGREIGSDFNSLPPELRKDLPPSRNWTDNPNDLLDFIEKYNGKYAIFLTAQPMRYIRTKGRRLIGEAMGIEKLFFDFDYDAMLKKKKEVSPEKIEKLKKLVQQEVKDFVSRLDPYIPLIVQTRKGYHVYIFLRRIYTFEKKDFDFAKEVYKELQMRIIQGEYKTLDMHIIGDIMRFSRVPLSIHQKSGKACQIVNANLKADKIRSLDFYRAYGIPESVVEMVVRSVQRKMRERHEREEERVKEAGSRMLGSNGRFTGTIRPCFKKKLDDGEMCHGQRLALLVEAYNSGLHTEDALVDLFRSFKDFKEETTRYQVRWFLDHQPDKYPPYRCSTIMEKNWCLENKCPLYNRKLNKAE